jgi:DNA-binding MarR family transcriptional regulator
MYSLVNHSYHERFMSAIVLGMVTTGDHPSGGVAFLLAQIGAHAATRFGQRMAEHELTPPQAGVLRILRSAPGVSQQELSERLGMQPSRVVAFVDELEDSGLVQRVRDDVDRRRNTVQLTAGGRRALDTIGRVARLHEDEICAALTDRERAQLARLLGRIADEQGLSPGVHPGYRSLGGVPRATRSTARE